MSFALLTRIHQSTVSRVLVPYRTMANLNRPAPPSLPREQQQEFEDLLRKAQAPLAQPSTSFETELHPNAREPLKAEFEGDINPRTGERGGPKREPAGQWGEDGGDWSFKGRVSDF
ncbi:Protein fmp21, mitochondrial [Leucoagaricus sp. SymC.cos]|nr:Protein fmp21, mitochondrial [Leucoagaricus sp. SymC.cos]